MKQALPAAEGGASVFVSGPGVFPQAVRPSPRRNAKKNAVHLFFTAVPPLRSTVLRHRNTDAAKRIGLFPEGPFADKGLEALPTGRSLSGSCRLPIVFNSQIIWPNFCIPWNPRFVNPNFPKLGSQT